MLFGAIWLVYASAIVTVVVCAYYFELEWAGFIVEWLESKRANVAEMMKTTHSSLIPEDVKAASDAARAAEATDAYRWHTMAPDEL